MAVSSHTDFGSESAEEFRSYGQFLMKYVITGGDEDGKEFPITMTPCEDSEYANFGKHYVESKNQVI